MKRSLSMTAQAYCRFRAGLLPIRSFAVICAAGELADPGSVDDGPGDATVGDDGPGDATVGLQLRLLHKAHSLTGDAGGAVLDVDTDTLNAGQNQAWAAVDFGGH